MIGRVISFALEHKIIFRLSVVFFLFGGFLIFKTIFRDDSSVKYISTDIKRETLIVSVSGSGLVLALNQVDVKPKIGGLLTDVYIKPGQEVTAGTLLATIDSQEVFRTLRDTETALETARLELEELLKPADALTLLQAENSLVQAKESRQKAEDNLIEVYEDGFNAVSSTFLDLPGIMSGLENLLFGKSIDPSFENISWYVNQTDYQDGQREKALVYKDEVYNTYTKAREAYQKNFNSYKITSRSAEKQVIEALVSETYNTTLLISDAIKNIDNYIDFVQDVMELRHLNVPQAVSTHQSNISAYTNKVNSILANLLVIQRSFKDSRDAIINAERVIKEKELVLAKIKEGADELSIRAKKIMIQQKEDALLTAKQKLADYYIRASFAGVISKVNVSKGDTVSAGTTIATLISKQKIAEISLNEVDAVKIKIGQKATLTFDAIPGLTLTGQVIEVDTVGTVSQGVVTYTAKIAFDTDDDRIKTSMSVSAAIIIEAKQNVLVAPNVAIKQQEGNTYVEIFAGENQKPRLQPVEIGLSNDTLTEIVSGLKEGDKVITQLITNNTSQSQTRGSAGLQIPGLTGSGFRIQRFGR